MQQTEYGQHDRHGHQGGPGYRDERHVDQQIEHNRRKQRGRLDPSGPKRCNDRKGQRHGAERKFLALLDMALDEDPPLRIELAERQFRMEQHDP